MFPLRPLAATVLALLPALGFAQQDKQPPNPLDSAIAVPQLSYESAFKQFQSSQNEKETPDRRWPDANRRLMPSEKSSEQTAPAESGHHGAHGGH